MKVYVMRSDFYDYYEFETLEAISRTKETLEELCKQENSKLPLVFTEAEHEKLFDTEHYYISHEELI